MYGNTSHTNECRNVFFNLFVLCRPHCNGYASYHREDYANIYQNENFSVKIVQS